MADTPDDSTQRPTPARSSKSAPPFFGPRKSDGSETTEPRARRRSSGLFVPPGSLPPEEQGLASTIEAPVPTPLPTTVPTPAPAVPLDLLAEGALVVDALFAEAPKSPPAAEPAPVNTAPPVTAPRPALRVSSYFELENLETPEINLKAERDRPSLGGSDLQVIEYADANSGLSSTTPPGGRPKLDGLELESTELTIELSQEASRDRSHAPSDLNVESFWAADAFTPTVRPTREVPKPAKALAPEPAAEQAAAPAAPAVGAPHSEPSALEALRVEEVLPPRSPTPPSVRVVTPRNSPPAPVEPRPVRTPAALEALKELEPWAVSAMERPEIAAAIAFELERVARRIRNGELRVRTDVTVPNEESALSAALQAISRTPRP